MNGSPLVTVSNRELRRAHRLDQAELRQLHNNLNVALNNEQVTRERVGKLEAQTRDLADSYARLSAYVLQYHNRNLWGRFRWLLRGR